LLTNDLGADGVDLDYEEFWHADINRHKWNVPSIYDLSLLPNLKYETVRAKFDGGKDAGSGGGGPWIMPETIAKFEAILSLLVQYRLEINSNLKFVIPAPAVGSIPTMTAKWGDASVAVVMDQGRAWYGGNLKGLIYNTAWKNPEILS